MYIAQIKETTLDKHQKPWHEDVTTWKCFPECWPFVKGNPWVGKNVMFSLLQVWKALEQTAKLMNILNGTMLMWRHCNALITEDLAPLDSFHKL